MSSTPDDSLAGGSLRERHVAHATPISAGHDPNNEDDVHENVDKERMTFGRTPDGTVFKVPETHDMVSQLLDPRQPKNLSDGIVLAIICMHIILLKILPRDFRIPVFAAVFLFWRFCYNVGIGYLLQIQSHHRRLVAWAKKACLFDDPSQGKNPRPWLYKLLKSELETKIPKDYKFEAAPIEYNTWLVFRRVVDLILMCDFTSYCLFAIACSHRPDGEGVSVTLARWIGGILLFGFNLWVKLDAHRVVKDYAWYWGDFFYLIDQELTFDGVFEMAPHPMYSVGYAGYYGISMMAASYNVLFISIIAHAAQFAFLIYVENPHIEKTYNPPPTKKRGPNPTNNDIQHANEVAASTDGDETPVAVDLHIPASSLSSASSPSVVHNLIGLKNTDPFRIIDVSVLLLIFYMVILTFSTSNKPIVQGLFVVHAAAWRIWYTIGLGIVLDKQSNEKMWTRHFIKFGEGTEEAWRQWKGIYHVSMTMCWASFIAATWKMYTLPSDWGYGMAILKHVLGAGLVMLHIWTATSIYDSLGEFGWFFGDFFFDYAPKLTYNGIYRYLNNPERILGLAGLWGAVFITNSKAIFFLALLSHTLALGFIQFVEKPHMQKLYGRSLRKDSGVTKSIRRSLPPPLKQWQGSVDKVLEETGHFVEDFLDAARPKLAAGVSTFVKDTSALFHQYPARVTVTRLAPDLAGYNPKDYSLEIENAQRTEQRGEFKKLILDYGAPIKVKWTAPANHSKKDWVGLYMVADNPSREATRIPSAGRWVPTNPNEYDSQARDAGIVLPEKPVSTTKVDDTSLVWGEVIFEGDKLFWTQGVFEFRYHHDGKHNVMAISQPFSIEIPRFGEEEDMEVDSNGLVRGAVEQALLPLVRNCFDRNPEIAPNTVDENFGALLEHDKKYAKRVVYAVRQMFGVEFAPAVVLADGTIRNLAWRICNAKQVLAPYSMSHSRGTTTPNGEKDLI